MEFSRIEMRTIAIDRTMCAGLFAIALDLLSPAFVTGAPDSSPLLHGQGRVLFEI